MNTFIFLRALLLSSKNNRTVSGLCPYHLLWGDSEVWFRGHRPSASGSPGKCSRAVRSYLGDCDTPCSCCLPAGAHWIVFLPSQGIKSESITFSFGRKRKSSTCIWKQARPPCWVQMYFQRPHCLLQGRSIALGSGFATEQLWWRPHSNVSMCRSQDLRVVGEPPLKSRDGTQTRQQALQASSSRGKTEQPSSLKS